MAEFWVIARGHTGDGAVTPGVVQVGVSVNPALRTVALLLAVVPALVVAALPVALWRAEFGIGDAQAYSLVAWNIVHGAGQTYDGVMPTNGFHPLWMLLHLPLEVGAAAARDRLGLVQILVMLTVLAAVGTWARVLARATGRPLAGLVMAAWLGASGWTLYVMCSGIEAPLVVLYVGLSILAGWRVQGDPSPRNAALLGLVGGLCFLARLDSFFFVGALGLLVLPALVRGGARSVGAAVLTGLAVGGPYLAWNQLRFGGPMPVSGLVKTNPTVDLGRSLQVLSESVHRFDKLVPPLLEPLVPLLFAGGAVLVLAVVAWLYLRLPPRPNLLVAVPVGAALHLVYYFVFIRELLVPWHMYLQVLAVFAAVAAALPRRFERAAAGVALVALVGSTAAYVYLKQGRRLDRDRSSVAEEWVAALPPGSRAAMIDGWNVQMRVAPESHVVELTGLVADRPTALLARDGRLAELADRHDVEYVVGFDDFVEQFSAFEEVKTAQVHWNHRLRTLVLARRR